MKSGEALCCSLLDDAIVTRSAISGTRRGRRIVIALRWRHWEVATPVELHDHAFHLCGVHRHELGDRGVTKIDPRWTLFEGAYYNLVETPEGLLRDVLTRLAARPMWAASAELRERLHLDTCIAEDGTVCAEFPNHYYRFDRELMDAAIEWVLALGEAIDAVLASEPARTPIAETSTLVPYRGAVPVVRANAPPPSYTKQARRLVLSRRWKQNRLVILLGLYVIAITVLALFL